MADCKCDAQYSGSDEERYRARGCPSCICGIIGGEEGDIVHAMKPIDFDEVFKRVDAAGKEPYPDQRYLMNHPESDCLFEVFTAADRLKSISEDGCDDVTGYTVYEKMFLMEEK